MIIKTHGGQYVVHDHWILAELHNFLAQSNAQGIVTTPAISFVLIRYDANIYTPLDIRIPFISFAEGKGIMDLLYDKINTKQETELLLLPQ